MERYQISKVIKELRNTKTKSHEAIKNRLLNYMEDKVSDFMDCFNEFIDE